MTQPQPPSGSVEALIERLTWVKETLPLMFIQPDFSRGSLGELLGAAIAALAALPPAQPVVDKGLVATAAKARIDAKYPELFADRV